MWLCLHSKYRSQGGHGINKNNRRPLRRPNHKSQNNWFSKEGLQLVTKQRQSSKEDVPNAAIDLNQTRVFDLYMVRCDTKKTFVEKRLDNELKYDNFSMLKS